jgi:LysM repeat protein
MGILPRTRIARFFASAVLLCCLSLVAATWKGWFTSFGARTQFGDRSTGSGADSGDFDDLASADRLDPFETEDRPLNASSEGGDASARRLKASLLTVGFEEESQTPAVSHDAGRSTGESAAPARETLAGRPTQASPAASNATANDDSPIKPRPLLDRQKIHELIDSGEYVEAQKELSQWYWQAPAERKKTLPDLNRMSRALYFSPQPQYYEPYVVKPGDQLRVVGQRYRLSWEYLARLNRIDPRRIRMGQKLKIVPGPFAAVVCLDRYELVVHLDGSYVKSYPVGLGKDGTTPLGTFQVKNKMVDPTYYGPDGVIAHDDPKNPLGERWIDIGDGFGIHGTIEPDSIGKNESRGCIRMLNSDVEEVYDFLVIGSEVKIIRK